MLLVDSFSLSYVVLLRSPLLSVTLHRPQSPSFSICLYPVVFASDLISRHLCSLYYFCTLLVFPLTCLRNTQSIRPTPQHKHLVARGVGSCRQRGRLWQYFYRPVNSTMASAITHGVKQLALLGRPEEKREYWHILNPMLQVAGKWVWGSRMSQRLGLNCLFFCTTSPRIKLTGVSLSQTGF